MDQDAQPQPDITRRRIEEQLKAVGLTMNAASELAGFDRSLLRKFIRWEVKHLSFEKLKALAAVLECSPAYLRGETDQLFGGPEDLDWLRAENERLRSKLKDIRDMIDLLIECPEERHKG